MYKIDKDYIIDGFNFIGGCAIPLVNHEFKPVDTLFIKSEKQAKKIQQVCNSLDTTRAEIFLLDEIGGKITLDTELSHVQD